VRISRAGTPAGKVFTGLCLSWLAGGGALAAAMPPPRGAGGPASAIQHSPTPRDEARPPAEEDGTEIEILEHGLDLGGATLRYLEAGSKAQDCVLLLHGARFHAGTWVETGTLEFLARKGYHVLALDLPGYGKSGRFPDGQTFHLAAFLDALKLDRVVLLSPSMSGRFAFPLLIEAPERVVGFIAVAPVGIADAAPRLRNPELPALLIWGSEDTVVQLSEAHRLEAALPDSELVVIEGASHPSYLDRPDEFHAAVLSFLDRLED
jgi:pimeloyl-ACP methyl ester carboxylesterase